MDPLSIIDSVIAIIEGATQTYKTIKAIVGLPEAFGKVANGFPFVQRPLPLQGGSFCLMSLPYVCQIRIAGWLAGWL